MPDEINVTEFRELLAERDRLQGEGSAQREEIARLEGEARKVAGLVREKERLEHAVDKGQAQGRTMSSALAASEDALSRERVKLAQLRESVAECAERDSRIEQLEAQLEYERQIVVSIGGQRDEERSERKRLEDELAARGDDIAKCERLAAALQSFWG